LPPPDPAGLERRIGLATREVELRPAASILAGRPTEASGARVLRALLARDRSSDERLRILADGDPLRLFQAGARRLRERALLVDTTRLHGEILLLAATVPLEGSSDLDRFVASRVDDAVALCLRRDRAAVREGVILGGQDHEFVEDTFGVENGLVAAHGFNSLAEIHRVIAFRLLFERHSLATVLEDGFGPLERVRRSLRTALTVLLEGAAEPCAHSLAHPEGGGD